MTATVATVVGSTSDAAATRPGPSVRRNECTRRVTPPAARGRASGGYEPVDVGASGSGSVIARRITHPAARPKLRRALRGRKGAEDAQGGHPTRCTPGSRYCPSSTAGSGRYIRVMSVNGAHGAGVQLFL